MGVSEGQIEEEVDFLNLNFESSDQLKIRRT